MTPKEYKNEGSWLLEGKEGVKVDDVEEHAILEAEEEEFSSSCLPNLSNRLKIGAYFALWYALNIVYNSK